MSTNWEPVCSLEHLRLRAQMLRQIRLFFAEKSVLEVETPLLCAGIGTDPNLDFFITEFSSPPRKRNLYLQTSPEFAMKRLLASGSGSIYQICKAFRNGEAGRCHNPEFTLLEWYRVGFDLSSLMAEAAELVSRILTEYLPCLESRRVTYNDVFRQYTGLDPLVFSLTDYLACAADHDLPEAAQICAADHAVWLDLLFSHIVQPALEKHCLYMIHDYPACLPSLARLNTHDRRVAERVEIFFNGLELGNGYHELTDAEEQGRRFNTEIETRKKNNLPAVTADRKLLDALTAGLPDCSGMAIGLDRLLMLISGSETIAEVLGFPIDNA